MAGHSTCDVCVIGAGAAGLSVAAGTARLGLRTVLIERARMGGECLNTGCVPSKALLSAAKAAHQRETLRSPGRSELTSSAIDFAGVKDGVQAVIDAIAPHDSAERFEALGVTVIADTAQFVDARTVRAGQRHITARWFVIATGSKAFIPAIPGLDAGKVLTNDSIFQLRERPDHLVIIGAGPIGIEMAVAHRRLGCQVTVIDRASMLVNDEPELVAMLRDRMQQDGITLVEGADLIAVDHRKDGVAVSLDLGGARQTITGSQVFVAAGRAPVVDGLGLEAAGVSYDRKGIAVDRRLRTSQRHIFALGDVIDGPRFTHVAGHQAGVVVRNLAFRLPAKVNYDALPWVTFSDPELSHVGLTQARARKEMDGDVAVQFVRLEKNDRAVAEHRTDGAIKVVTGRGGRILGASILAPAAGEMISLWCLAVQRRMTMKAISDLMLPYPTMGEIAKAAAGQHFEPIIFGARVRKFVRALRWLPI